VVFRDGRRVDDSCGEWDIWAVDLSTGIEFPITMADDMQNNPSVYGDIVVRSDDGAEIWMRDLSTGKTSELDTGDDACCMCNPFIWDDTIIWVDDRGDDEDIWMYDLVSQEATIAAGGEGDQDMPELYGDNLVYRTYLDPGYSIDVMNLATGVSSQVSTSTEYTRSPSIWGDRAVWVQGDDAFVYDLATAKRTQVCSGTAEGCIDISENLIVWQDDRNTCNPGLTEAEIAAFEKEDSDGTCMDLEVAAEGVAATVEDTEDTGSGKDIYGYDLNTGTEFVVCDEDGGQKRPRIHEGTVVWVDMRECLGDDITGPNIWGVHLEPMYSTLQGDDRFETAVQSSRKAFPTECDTVIIATGFNWPDALVSSALAGGVNGPILLMRAGSLPAVTAAEVQRLGAENVYIIGGEAAISMDVQEDLEVMLDGFVTRIQGSERCETANLVAREAVDVLGADFDGTALVVTSLHYPDALSAAPVAAADGTPMFLVGANGIDAGTMRAMRDLSVTDVIIVGGPAAVSAATEAQLVAEFTTAGVDRISGATRYDTAANMAQYGVDEVGLAWDGVALATGRDFPDALTGGVMQGLMGSTLLLTPSYDLHAAVSVKLAD
jgi:putative cell wall-binding protein